MLIYGPRWGCRLGRRHIELCGCLIRRRVVHSDPEVGGDASEAGGVALAHRTHLPGPLAPVQLDEHQRRLNGQPDRIETGELPTPKISDGDLQRLDGGEGQRTGSVQTAGDDDLVDVGRYQRQGELERGGWEKAHPRTSGLVEEHEVGVRTDLAARRHQQRGDVQRSRRADLHTYIGSGQRCVRALAQDLRHSGLRVWIAWGLRPQEKSRDHATLRAPEDRTRSAY